MAIIISLLMGLGLSSKGREAINHPATDSGFAHVLAVPYRLLLDYGGAQLVNGEVGTELWMQVLLIDAVVFAGTVALVVGAAMWLCFFFSRDKRGGNDGGHGGKNNEVP
jgi:hypothetical protein